MELQRERSCELFVTDVKIFFLTVLLLLSFACGQVRSDALSNETIPLAALAQTQKPTAITTLAVEVEGGKSLRLAAADLAKLSRIELKAKDHDGKDSNYTGFLLRDVLTLADAKFGKDFRGAQLGNFVLIEAADGDKAVFAAAEDK